jgi:hypothetical protein
MEYVDGVTLRHLLATQKTTTREALAIVPQICDALQFAHDRGIVPGRPAGCAAAWAFTSVSARLPTATPLPVSRTKSRRFMRAPLP